MCLSRRRVMLSRRRLTGAGLDMAAGSEGLDSRGMLEMVGRRWEVGNWRWEMGDGRFPSDNGVRH
jgi:hypothetical protein